MVFIKRMIKQNEIKLDLALKTKEIFVKKQQYIIRIDLLKTEIAI